MMATKKDSSVDSAAGRKAYGLAMKALRESHQDEFNDMLDAAYAEQGMVSPRVRRMQRQAAAAEARAAAAERREARRVAKIERLKAELSALAPGDPLF